MRINVQGLKDNAQHIAGIFLGLTLMRLIPVRFSREARGMFWFSSVAANLAADGEPFEWCPYAVIVRNPAPIATYSEFHSPEPPRCPFL